MVASTLAWNVALRANTRAEYLPITLLNVQRSPNIYEMKTMPSVSSIRTEIE